MNQAPAAPNMRRELGLLKSALHGHENKLRALDPVSLNRRPYNSLVVQQTLISEGTSIGVQVSGIVKALLGQLGLATQDATLINIKIRRCDCWAASKANSTVRPAVSADFSSLVPTVADPTTPGNAIVAYPNMKRLSDLGGVTSAARVSYSWPTAMADIPLNQNADFVVMETASNITEIDVRWHVLWNTADIASPTTFRLGSEEPPPYTSKSGTGSRGKLSYHRN